MSVQKLFQRQTELVRDSELVTVGREVLPNGDICYKKRFKATGFDIWAKRENRFFSLFQFKELRYVVRPRKTEYTEQGVAEVETMDAGLTIEEWLQVSVLGGDGNLQHDAFMLGDNCLRLAHACLSALFEIHQQNVIHCDIKPDNICLPYLPKQIRQDLTQPVQIDFANLRLIDFSFSLSPDIPLQDVVLPINSQSANAEYLSPEFRQAILADQQAKRPHQVNQLDYRIDLYSLAYMLEKLVARTGIVWTRPQHQAFIKQLIQELQQLPATPDWPHPKWIQALTAMLALLPTESNFRVVNQLGSISSTQFTPITPLLATPIAMPVLQEPVVAPSRPVATDQPAPVSKPAKASRIKWWLAGGLTLLAAASAAWFVWEGQSVAKPVAAPKSKPIAAAPLIEEAASAVEAAPVERLPFEPEMVAIPGTNFELGKYEITVAEYLSCVAAGGCPEPEWREFGSDFNYQTGSNDAYRQLGAALTAEHNPIVGVSWHDAQAYVTWLSAQTGKNYRLPTESEWQYACLGGNQTEYCGGDDVDSLAWYEGNSSRQTHPVGLKQANAFGLYDMSGNVWEWQQDTQDAEQKYRVLKGGSWSDYNSDAGATDQGNSAASDRLYIIGFRVARTIP